MLGGCQLCGGFNFNASGLFLGLGFSNGILSSCLFAGLEIKKDIMRKKSFGDLVLFSFSRVSSRRDAL